MSPLRLQAIPSYGRLLFTALVLFIADQVTKTWIFNTLPLGSYFPPDWVPVAEGFFYIVHIGNEGAAWGLLTGYGTFLAIFALVALAAIYHFRHSLELHRPGMQYAFGLLVGGVVGNLVDRLLHGHVIDFLDFHLPFTLPWILENGRWPAFNLADCGITGGVALYVLLSFVPARRPSSAQSE
jgi:signal peptidase II